MRIDPKADVRFLRPELSVYLFNIERIFLHHALPELPDFECYLYSGNDRVHGRRSLHGKNRALDLRTRLTVKPYTRLSVKVRRAIVRDLKRLSPDFDVRDEGDHIHLEHDPK